LVANAFVRELEPFYFGELSAPLYGCFHLTLAPKRSYVAVLCPPMGDEAIRVHRAYKQLALRLSRAGFPALRFDYFGMGDSSGDDVDATLSRWESDIALAIEEAKKRSGATQVILIGLRMGASLALRVASQRGDVSGAVVWEPIVSGADYLSAMAEAHQNKLNYFLTEPINQSDEAQDVTELLGFVLSARMRAEIESLNLLNLAAINARQRVFLLERASSEAVEQLKVRLQSQSNAVSYQCLDDPPIWGEDPDKGLVPGQTFKAIISWFSEKLL
jgi:pimeloyl-ACP methyl ester carboxylesterase